MTPEVYAVIAARRIVRGLPVLPKNHPETVAAAQDPEVQRRAAMIKHKVDEMPSLTGEQIEKLRGLLPAVPRANPAPPRRQRRKPPGTRGDDPGRRPAA